MHLSIKQRIYLSFSVLVAFFVINGIITNITLNNQKKLSERLFGVVDPSIQALDDFKKMLLESKMYTTNWVFLRYNEQDKELLVKLHDSGYHALKTRIDKYAVQWVSKTAVDSLNRFCRGFEELIAIEKSIMASLQQFSDYDDPVLKLEAERKVEEEILPRTDYLLNMLNNIHSHGINHRKLQNSMFERSSIKLRMSMVVLTITIIGAGIFLSLYLTKVIIAPVKRISNIVNDMGKGITRKIDYESNRDEIGAMVRSVNNLSDTIQATANFAHEVGLRNFKAPFQPLSEEDTLGKSLIAMRDNLKKGEINLEKKNRELERKNKELEQFAYVASHDLQEPLRTISSFVELLRQQYVGRLDEHADKYLAYIVQSSDRMKVFIKDLLDYSRIGNERELQKVDCNKIIGEVLSDIGKAIDDGNATVHYNDLPVINAYPTEIKHLFQNLITNAIKFRKKDVAARVDISAEKSDAHWTFTVKDNGIGIEEKHRERIFIIFQRLHTRTEYEGSGIGLSHCKKIVELHGGKIWIESKPGIGTSFHFSIPRNYH